MKKTTKLRLYGGLVLLFNLWLVGYYNLEGIPVLLLTLGFAAGYEFFVVNPASKVTGDTLGNTTSSGKNFCQYIFSFVIIAIAVCSVMGIWQTGKKKGDQLSKYARDYVPSASSVPSQPVTDQKTLSQQEFDSEIFAKHPDARALLPEIERWVAAQSPQAKAHYDYVLDHGTANEVIELLNIFKQSTGRMTTATPVGQQPAEIFAGTNHKGTVVQTMDSGGYTYAEIAENGHKLWVAAVQTPVKVGDIVEFPHSPPMVNFQSKTLKRTFDNLIFAPVLAVNR
ncbi:hypothetical protein [Geomonas paludis]|uniref:Uncharacterized protein n=1 Tax=Geomonas paludis TaxID=2740185 RepID=A0A6V8MSN5_9BACT|nr:hypothetical protein [Geomonas paludis]GFO63166.1 hypothetical protein GMPD_10850 [Geomonas paludis]